jgi:hypothetical protein
VHPNGSKGGVFMCVKAYWDESGINPESPVCIVAGYYGGNNQWREFDRNWKSILEREGVEEFHAKPFWARDKKVGPYKEWSDSRAKRFLDDLVSAAISVKIHPVAHTVVKKHWEELPEHKRRWLTRAKFHRITHKTASTGAPSQPYFLSFQHCVDAAAQQLNSKRLMLHCVFDLNPSLSGYAQLVWASMKEDKRLPYCDQLGDLVLSDSKAAPGLQLADLLAFRSRRYAEKKLANPKAHHGELLTKLLTRAVNPKHFLMFTDKSFEEINHLMPEYLRGDSVLDSKHDANAEDETTEGI